MAAGAVQRLEHRVGLQPAAARRDFFSARAGRRRRGHRPPPRRAAAVARRTRALGGRVHRARRRDHRPRTSPHPRAAARRARPRRLLVERLVRLSPHAAARRCHMGRLVLRVDRGDPLGRGCDRRGAGGRQTLDGVRLPLLRHDARVRGVSPDHAHRRPASARRFPARRGSPHIELSVRAHGVCLHALHRPRDRPEHRSSTGLSRESSPGCSPSWCLRRSGSRACTAACTTRPTCSPASCSRPAPSCSRSSRCAACPRRGRSGHGSEPAARRRRRGPEAGRQSRRRRCSSERRRRNGAPEEDHGRRARRSPRRASAARCRRSALARDRRTETPCRDWSKNFSDRDVDRLIIWGGDGTVRACIDAVGSAPVTLAIMPAGTANLLAANLGIPTDLEARARRRSLGPAANAWTSARSTGSASASWPASGSTR